MFIILLFFYFSHASAFLLPFPSQPEHTVERLQRVLQLVPNATLNVPILVVSLVFFVLFMHQSVLPVLSKWTCSGPLLSTVEWNCLFFFL